MTFVPPTPPTLAKSFSAAVNIASAPTGASEVGTTVTITTTSAHGFANGQSVVISGVGVAGYNGTFTITGATSTTFTYTAGAALLASSGGGSATSITASIPLNSTASLGFTITNNNVTLALTGITFTDVLPTGLSVANATTPNVCGAGSSLGVVAATRTITLTGGSLSAANPNPTKCTFSVVVTGSTPGTWVNTTGNITSVEVGPGGTASATLIVVAPPVIAKTFNPALIPLNATTSLDFTITNPAANTVALMGVAFADTLPAGLTIADSSVGICGGTRTTTASTGIISLTGATIAVGGTCTFSVAVTGTLGGQYTNVTGAVTSANGGTGNTATAVLTVSSADLSITKTDGVSSAPAGSTVTYTIVATNNGPNPATGATVTDTFPAAISSVTWGCVGSGGGTCGAVSGNGNINQIVNLPASGTVTFVAAATISPNATGNLTNTATITPPLGTNDPNPGNNSATDIDTLTAPSIFVIDDVSKLEGNAGTTPFVFTVTKTGATGFATAVQYQTIDGSATVANLDYQATSGTLNFGPADVTKTITVLVNGDTTIEPNEIFTVHLLNNPVNALIGDADGQGTIQNDDGPATPTPTPTPVPTPTPTPTPPNRFEGDINRTAVGVPGTGDGDVNVGDQIQYQRFLNGTDCPSTNEQPRLDAGPRATLGDGQFGAVDGTAIDAYARHDAATDFDPNVPNWQPTPSGGPAAITNLGCAPTADPEDDAVNMGAKAVPEAESAAAARVVHVVSGQGRRNSYITVDIEMAAQGNEAGTQFGLHFDPAVLSVSETSGVNVNPDITLGADAPTGTTLNVNAADAANGNIGIVENFNAAHATLTTIPAAATRIARVRFHVLDGAVAGASRITFDDAVLSRFTVDINGFSLAANYDQNGAVTVAAPPGFRIAGRVTTPDGRGLRNATVTIVDRSGFVRTVMTSAFGYYVFDGVAAGERYTIGVASREYRFASRSVEVGDNLADVNFFGLE